MFDIFPNLRAVLETTPARWHAFAAAFPEDLLRRQPAHGEWSALECLQHLIELDRDVFPQRVRAILAGENFPAYYPDEEGSALIAGRTARALADEFAALRQVNLALLESIRPEDLERQASHAELGPVTLGNLLHEWGGHDLMHLVQAEQALMQPFIAGCGAWQVYFTQHVVTPREG